MKKISISAALIGLLFYATFLAASTYYKLEWVKRVDQDLYSAKSGTAKVLIETKFCYEIAIGDDATLKYDAYSYDNKIIFNNDQSCDVQKVIVQ
jgi:hypothetical protein